MKIDEKVAQLLERVDSLTDVEGGIPKVLERLKQVEDAVGPIGDIDLKSLAEQVEKMRAGQDSLADQIRRSRRGLYVSGIEDEPFSLLKAICGYKAGGGSKAGFEKVGAGHEFEIMRQATDKARDVYAKAGMNAGDNEQAASFIPDQVIADVIEAIYTKSAFVNLTGEDGQTTVSVLEGLFGGMVKIPKFNGGMIAYWVGEKDPIPESEVNTGDVRLSPHKLAVLTRITEEMQRWAGFGFERLFRRDMVRAAAKLLDYTIAFGNGGDNSPRGIVHTKDVTIYSAESGKTGLLGTTPLGDTSVFQADWQGAELTFDGLDDMALEREEDNVDRDESWKIASGPRYFRRLARSKILTHAGQQTGQPYLLGAPMLPESRLVQLIGDIAKSTQFATGKPGASLGAPTTSTEAAFQTVIQGNLSDVVLGRWGGLEISDDGGRGVGFTSDQVYAKVRLWVDCQVRQPRSLSVCPDARVKDAP